MFLQHWADNQCCRCIPPWPDHKTRISGDCSDLTIQDVGICGVKCCIADLFCLLGNIRPGSRTISLFFGALKLFFDFFVFLVEISRLYESGHTKLGQKCYMIRQN